MVDIPIAFTTILSNILMYIASMLIRNFLNMQRHNEESRKRRIIAAMMPLMEDRPAKRRRRLWVRPRSQALWLELSISDDQFFSNFRMSRYTFNKVCDLVRPHMAPAHNIVRPSLSVEKKVAIAIYKLASCSEYRVIAANFGVSKATVNKCVYQFCDTVIEHVMKDVIKLPGKEEAIAIASRFRRRTGFPQVYGAIDGSHIPITPPKEGYRDYINRKMWPSLVLQALVDDRYMFRNISCNAPGCVHDASVLKKSNLYKVAHRGQLPQAPVSINGTTVNLMVVADPAYPLENWLMKPYSGQNLTEKQLNFNYKLSSTRMVVENAFGRLKQRWRILLKKSELNYKQMPKVVATCCVLHNICEEAKEPLIPSDSSHIPLEQPLGGNDYTANSSQSQIRETIANYLIELL